MEKRLTDEQANDIKKQAEDNPLYILVRDIILDMEEHFGELSPKPEEVFLWVAHNFDSFLDDERPIERAQRIWNETCHSVRTINPNSHKEAMEKLVGVEISILIVCIFSTGCFHLTDSCAKMQELLDKHIGKDCSDSLRNGVLAAYQNNRNISDWIVRSYQQETSIIGNLNLDGNENNEIVSRFRIAKNQKTNFAKVIKAMVDVGMFEIDGKPLTTINKLIPQLGEFFGEDYKNLSQLFSRAKEGNTYIHIFDDLKNKASEYMNKS